MGQLFSRPTVSHAPTRPRHTSRQSSSREWKSSSGPPSPTKSQTTRRLHSRGNSSSSIHVKQQRQAHSRHPSSEFPFPGRSEQVPDGRPTSSGTARSSRTQPTYRNTKINQEEEPFTPLPPPKVRQSPAASPKYSTPIVESSNSTSSGAGTSDGSSYTSHTSWSGRMPTAPIPPNWDREFYSGISPRRLQGIRNSDSPRASATIHEVHRNPAPRLTKVDGKRYDRYQPQPHDRGTNDHRTPPRKRSFVRPGNPDLIEVEVEVEAYPYEYDMGPRSPRIHNMPSQRFEREIRRPPPHLHPHPSMDDPFVDERYVHVWPLR